MAEIKNGDYLTVTTESVDKNGKMTTGKSGRIIYGKKSDVKESPFYKFSRAHSYTYRELTALLKFSQTYPKMYDVFEKHQQDVIKKGLNSDKIDFDNPYSMYQYRIALHRQNLGKEGMNNFKPPEIDEQMLDYSIFKEFLPKSLDFVNEVNLNYIVSLFEIYLSRVIDAVLEITISSNIISTEKITSDLIRKIVGSPESMKKMLKEIFGFNIVNKEWDTFLELFERRNCLTHNDGNPTKKYMKTFHVDKNQNLTPNIDYISNSISLIEEFMAIIHSYFYSKFIKTYIYEKFLD
jgi:hypothetical protein